MALDFAGFDNLLDEEIFNGAGGHAHKHNQVNDQVNWLTQMLRELRDQDPDNEILAALFAAMPGLDVENSFTAPQTFRGATGIGAQLRFRPSHEDGYASIVAFCEGQDDDDDVWDVGFTFHKELSGTEVLHRHMSIYSSPALGENPVARFNIEYGVADAQIQVSRAHLDFDTSAAPNAGGGYAERVILKNNGAVAAWIAENTNYVNLINLNGGNVFEVGSTGHLTAIAFYPGAAEKMRLTPAGRLGLGTDAPAKQVHVKGAGSAIRLEDSTAYDIRTFGDDLSFSNVTTGAHQILLSVGGNVSFNSLVTIEADGDYVCAAPGRAIIMKAADGNYYKLTPPSGGGAAEWVLS